MVDPVTLLDFSSTGPGPRCTRMLADYGMRVVKIRPPSGGTSLLEGPWYNSSANRGITALHLDLKHPAGRGLIHRLMARADAVIESYRPGVAARLGVGYDDARAVNPSVVYCSISAYGQHGPYAARTAHELNFLALAGFLTPDARSPDGAPLLPGSVVADAFGGYDAAGAVLSALLTKQRTGAGAYLDVSIVDSVLRAMRLDLDRHLSHEVADQQVDPSAGTGKAEFGDASSNDLLTGGTACYGVYQAGDGRWIAIAAIETPTWTALCRGVGLVDRIPDQFAPSQQADLRRELAAVFATRPAAAWVAELGATACLSPVNAPPDVLTDPHLLSRPLTIQVQVHGRGVRQLAPRLAVPDPPDLAEQPAGPSTAADVDRTLRELGLADAEIADLRATGVLG